MTTGPSYSIASCVVETAHRLIATPGSSLAAEHRRLVGRALLTAEVLGFGSLASGIRPRDYGQGLEVRLGFYGATEVAVVVGAKDLVADELSESIGGWPRAVQIAPQLMPEGEGWLGTGFAWPDAVARKHLNVLLDSSAMRDGRDRGQLRVIGRRLRYRLGVDHANGAPDLFWWTTAQTEHWIERYLDPSLPAVTDEFWERPSWSRKRAFNRHVHDLFSALYPSVSVGVDPSLNSADDWGCVRLEGDPIRVLSIGPASGGQTRADVTKTLARAGDLLIHEEDRARHEGSKAAGHVQAEALNALLKAETKDIDVVLLYRGGFTGSNPPEPATCNVIIDAAEALTKRGVEVVLGLGHGTTSIHGIAGREPSIGVHEAVTPTAASNWILTEHINQRLMNAVPDPGQFRPYEERYLRTQR